MINFELFKRAIEINEIPNHVTSTLQIESPLSAKHYHQLLTATFNGIKTPSFTFYQSGDMKRNNYTVSLCSFIETIFTQTNSTNSLGIWGLNTGV